MRWRGIVKIPDLLFFGPNLVPVVVRVGRAYFRPVFLAHPIRPVIQPDTEKAFINDASRQAQVITAAFNVSFPILILESGLVIPRIKARPDLHEQTASA